MKKRVLAVLLSASLMATCMAPMGTLQVKATEPVQEQEEIQVTMFEPYEEQERNVVEEVSGNSVYNNAYIDMDETLAEDKALNSVNLLSLDEEKEAALNLPATYRSDAVSVGGNVVSYVPTAFRNQGDFGTCWSFSALGACEASLIKKGLANTSIDLSERHLAYYMYNKWETGDSKGGTTGDYNYIDDSYYGAKNYLQYGGNNSWTMWHLASWCGPVPETMAPYSGLTSDTTDEAGLMGQANSTAVAYESDICHVQNVYKIALGNMDDGVAEPAVKDLIMKYGALGISYWSDNSYDDPEFDSFYNDERTKTNHAVQVIGWDDNFPAENFWTEAPGDGAWLIKNSWGDESDYRAQYGCFWLSYYDASINSYVDDDGDTVMKYAYVYDAEAPDNYDHIYQYDGDSSGGYIPLQTVSNRFTAGDGDGKWDLLQSVGIGVAQSNVKGAVAIYRDLENTSGDPTAGELVHTQAISLQYPGYHTIPLTKDIYVADGTQFSVIFYFETDTNVNVSYDSSSSYSALQFVTYENQDVSAYQSTYTNYWNDLNNYVLRIKAYSDDANNYYPPMLRSFTMNRGTANITAGESLQLAASQTVTPSSVGETKQFAQTWSSSNTSVATVSAAGLVKGVKAGQATITVSNGNVKASCVVTVKPKKTTLSSVSLTSKNKAKLKWKKVSGAEGYQVYRATSENGTYKKFKTIKKGSTVTLTADAYKGSKPYYYKVRAYKTIAGKKVYGEFSVIKTCGPSKVTVTKAAAKSGKKIKVTWKKTTNASGYEVYRATSKKGKYKKVKTLSGKKKVSFTDSSLKKGKTYYYKVRAYRTIKGKKVYGSYSDIVSAKAKK